MNIDNLGLVIEAIKKGKGADEMLSCIEGRGFRPKFDWAPMFVEEECYGLILRNLTEDESKRFEGIKESLTAMVRTVAERIKTEALKEIEEA